MTYWLCLWLLLGARLFDLGSTWLVSPDLKLERNPFIRWCGWTLTLVFNVLAVLVIPFCPIAVFWTLFGASLGAGLLNLTYFFKRSS